MGIANNNARLGTIKTNNWGNVKNVIVFVLFVAKQTLVLNVTKVILAKYANISNAQKKKIPFTTLSKTNALFIAQKDMTNYQERVPHLLKMKIILLTLSK